MILVDSNLLLYARDQASPQHGASKRWLEAAINGTDTVLLPLVSLLSFLRIATNPQVFQQPLTMEAAMQDVAEWLARRNVVVPGPTERHWEILAHVVRDAQIRGPALTDAHLAALTIEHGATLYTADRGFARFRGLKLVDPLVP